MGSTGVYARRCEDADGFVEWVDDKSTCLASLPQQGISFVDWSFRMTRLYYTDWPDVKEKFIAMLLRHITVFREQIAVVLVRDRTEDEVPVTQVYLRFAVNSRIGDYIQYSLDLYRDDFDTWVKSEVGDSYESSIVGDVKLRNPVNYTMIGVCALVALVVIILAIGWYRAHLSVKEMKGKKTLKRVENSETGVGSTLLAVEWGVCCNKGNPGFTYGTRHYY